MKIKKAIYKVKKGIHGTKKYKVWHTTAFRRPKTLQKKPHHLVKQRAGKKYNTFDKWAIIKYPIAS